MSEAEGGRVVERKKIGNSSPGNMIFETPGKDNGGQRSWYKILLHVGQSYYV